MQTMTSHQFKPVEFVRTVWSATAASGVTIPEVLAPEYWVHVAPKLKIGDMIEISPESSEWFCVLLVRAVSAAGPTLAVLQKHDFDGAGPIATDGYEVKYAGGAAKWRVVRKADRHVLVEGLQNRQAAEAWMAENLKTDLV